MLFFTSMTVAIPAKHLSPVDVEDRRELDVRPGDTVRVHQKIQEKGKTRIQLFEGLVIARKHGAEAGATFTVRATLSGVGVEKIFPLYSPMIDKIEVIRRSKVRRAKLYYIRDKVAREMRRGLRRMIQVNISTGNRTKVDEVVAESAGKEVEVADVALEEAPTSAENK